MQALISKSALIHNVRQVRKLAPKSKILAMVKSNAYGHDLAVISNILQDQVEALGVARIFEAQIVREIVGDRARIVLMHGITTSEELCIAHKLGLEIVIHDIAHLDLLTKFPNSCKLWIKFDTGMHRLGFDIFAAQRILQTIKKHQLIGVMTHFSDASLEYSPKTIRQLQLFNSIFPLLPPGTLVSSANSAAILQFPESHYDIVRPGLMLYGISPLSLQNGIALNLKPVMQLVSKVISVKKVAKGGTIGYGSTFRCTRDLQIAIVAVGYGDGYTMRQSNFVLIKDKKCPILGDISMDLAVVDISHCSNVTIGEEVTLIGGELYAEDIAKDASISVYWLLTNLSRRVTVSLVD